MTTPRILDGRISRRTAIGGGLIAAASFATAGPTFGDNLDVSAGRIAPVLPEDHWANMVGEVFRIVKYAHDDQDGNARRTRLRLAETSLVIPVGGDVKRPEIFRPHAISLVFRGSTNIVLAHASYTLEHPRLGEFNLYLSHTCSKRFKWSNVYEAIINN